MAEPDLAAPTGSIAVPKVGIEAIRRSLGFGEREAALVRSARERLAGEVEGWVDGFYGRLMIDPAAATLLEDEGRVIRLKRSLIAWFHELFSLPFDEAYERARAAIGLTHVRIRMPQYLMVTAMGTLRGDIFRSIHRVYGDEPDRRAIARAVSKALDLELALMLGAYRREEFAEARQRNRLVYTERALHRFQRLSRNRIDQALCLAELASDPGHPRAEEALAELRDTLREMARMEYALRAPTDSSRAREDVSLAQLCAHVVSSVGRRPSASIDVSVTARRHAGVVLCGLPADRARRRPPGRLRAGDGRQRAPAGVASEGWGGGVRHSGLGARVGRARAALRGGRRRGESGSLTL